MSTIDGIRVKKEYVEKLRKIALASAEDAINAPSKRKAEEPLDSSKDAALDGWVAYGEALALALDDVKTPEALALIKDIRIDAAKASDAAMQAVIACESKVD